MLTCVFDGYNLQNVDYNHFLFGEMKNNINFAIQSTFCIYE